MNKTGDTSWMLQEFLRLPVFLLYFTVPLWRPLRGPLPFHLHPGRLTWNLQITHLERKIIFQNLHEDMFHVNLQESTRTVFLPLPRDDGMTDMTGCLLHRGGQCHRDMWGSWCVQQCGSSGSWLAHPCHFRYTKLPLFKRKLLYLFQNSHHFGYPC